MRFLVDQQRAYARVLNMENECGGILERNEECPAGHNAMDIQNYGGCVFDMVAHSRPIRKAEVGDATFAAVVDPKISRALSSDLDAERL